MNRNPNALCHSLDPKQTYYDLPAGETVSLAEIAACWVFKRAKPRSGGRVLLAPVYELWPWRLFRYRGLMEDETHWDRVKTAVAQGWNLKKPICVGFGDTGVVIVHDGNHRLQMARELELTHVPVELEELSHGQTNVWTGVKPYLQSEAAAVHRDALKCDPVYFARVLEKISSQPTSVSEGKNRDWAWLVSEVLNECVRAGRFGGQYEKPRGWYQDKGFESHQRKKTWDAYVRWIELQKMYMQLTGTTWPLKYVWPHVEPQDLFADLRALKGDRPEWLSEEDMTRWYAGRLYVDSQEIERYVKEKREAELAQMTAEQLSERDRDINKIMELLGAK